MDTIPMTLEETQEQLANAKRALEDYLPRQTVADGVGTALRGLVDDSTLSTGEAKAVHTAIMSELDITSSNPFVEFDVEVTFPDGDTRTIRVTADDEDSAIDSVKDDITIYDVTLHYTVSIDGARDASVEDSDFSVDDSDIIDQFSFDATEVSD